MNINVYDLSRCVVSRVHILNTRCDHVATTNRHNFCCDRRSDSFRDMLVQVDLNRNPRFGVNFGFGLLLGYK